MNTIARHKSFLGILHALPRKISRHFKGGQLGNSLLELLLFLPLILFFIFTVIDFSSYLVLHAKVSNIVRSHLTSTVLYQKKSKVVSFSNESLDYVLEFSQLESIVDTLASKIEQDIVNTGLFGRKVTKNDYDISICLALLSIDSNTGKLTNFTVLHPLVGQRGYLKLAGQDHNISVLREKLTKDYLAQPSHYSIVESVSHLRASELADSIKYLDFAVLIGARVSLVSKGISPVNGTHSLKKTLVVSKEQYQALRLNWDM